MTMIIILALAFAAAAFTLSASAGLGGSLILVPSMSMLLGAKQGVALSALLLGCNNVAKVFVYRRWIPLRTAVWVLLLTIAGTGIGAKLLVDAPESWVSYAVIGSFSAAFLFEQMRLERLKRIAAPVLAFGAGATSGFSGTSGPLKGVAIRNLGLDRLRFIGAASAVSFAGDAMKTAVFAEASLLGRTAWLTLLAAIPLMVLATLAGRRLNRGIGERAFRALFWMVMLAYAARLAIRW